MSTKPTNGSAPPPVPVQYSGKWIAWSIDHSQIVASAQKLEELWRIVKAQQIVDPTFEKVLRADCRFVGMR